MKPKAILSFIIYLLTSFPITAQLITIETKIRKDDGSSKLRNRDSVHILDFSFENLDKKFEYTDRNQIDFELINSSEFKRIFKAHKYTWLFIQASGCGGCSISYAKYSRLADSLSGQDIKLVVVNQDIDIKQLQKKLFEEKYGYHSYIIDPKIYGTIEIKKQEQFVKELTMDFRLDDYSAQGVPTNLFFDRDGNLVYYNPVNRITGSEIEKYVIKQN